MENLTWTATTDKGNEYEYIAYEDPFPGRKGSERIKSDCGRCGGTGVYQGPSGYKFHTPAVGAVDTGCFHCEGRGYTSSLVSSLRASERRRINAANARRAADADFLAEAPVREAQEMAEALEAAYAEQARRDAKAKGHLGEIGERLRNLNAEVVMEHQYEDQNFVTGAPESKTILKFRTASGHVLVWYTSWTTLREGDKVSLTGTVKKHSSRDGEDQTIITRCIVK